MRFVDDQLIDAEFLKLHADVLRLLIGQALELIGNPLAGLLQVLDRRRVLALIARGLLLGRNGLIHLFLVELAISLLRHADTGERRMRDDDAIPAIRCRLGRELATALGAHLVLRCNQQLRIGVGLVELRCELVQHVVRNDEHGALDHAKTLHLHRRHNRRPRLARPDDMIEQRVALLDDTPDCVHAVGAEVDRAS